MTQQFIDMWNETADAFDARHAGLGDAHWDQASNCEGWSVKELVEHTVGTQAGMGGMIIGAQIPEGADWPTARDGIRAALEQEGALDGTVNMPPMGGDVPKTMVFGILITDMLLHTWDVARSTGQDEVLPAGPVTAAYMGLQRMPPEMMKAEGRFAPSVECAEDADEQTKLICYSGRQA